MAGKKDKRRAKLGGTIAVIIIATAIVLYFSFREHFAAAFAGVVGIVLGAVSLIVGIIPLFSPSPEPPVQQAPPAPQPGQAQPTYDIDVKAGDGGYASGRDMFNAGRDMNIGTDGSKYAPVSFPMTPRERPAGESPAENKAAQDKKVSE